MLPPRKPNTEVIASPERKPERQKNQHHLNSSSAEIIIPKFPRKVSKVMEFCGYLIHAQTVYTRPFILPPARKKAHRKKRMRQLQKKLKSGTLDVKEDDPFELFVAATEIRYCYYSETHKILGNTYGMCVLQDFEALTPNLLARTVETVEGGGLVVLLLRSMHSLRQLCTMTMDVHARYRTKAHEHVVARFNERFLLSLADCSHCIVLDDHLNVLPISSHLLSMEPVVSKVVEGETRAGEMGGELIALKGGLADTQPVGQLVNCCKTLDQAKALLKIVEAISEQTLRSTVAMTASRGRGKSATLGLAVAAAVAFGYSNIFVTSPSPENLRTLFEFLLKGFDSVEYKEHEHYEVIQSTNKEFNHAVVRVNIFQQHRQTVQYIHPEDAHKLEQAEMLCIDEAAAIPLPLVKKLFGPYLILMASTINGYEGTGRSLSLKLIEGLRHHSARSEVGGRTLTEISLDEPIRYASQDPIESWLHQLLCLDAGAVSGALGGCPSPTDCNLYYVNRDTLFCYHKASEAFLQQLMALYVSSHYKNSPNDLQLLSDAPAHHIFVLLGPVATDAVSIPEVLSVLQVCLEGAIGHDFVRSSLSRGRRESGDLIPWTLSQQFADPNFAELSGVRVVRIATHPDYQGMGYGTRAMKLLMEYYSGQTSSLFLEGSSSSSSTEMEVGAESAGLLHETIAPRTVLPPLLTELSERQPETLDYIGVSFGLTSNLLRFWCQKNGFVPVYLRQTANELTGEHSCIMLRTLTDAPSHWLRLYYSEFRRRYLNLLGRQFRSFPPALALGLFMSHDWKPGSKVSGGAEREQLSHDVMAALFSKIDLQLLEQYTRNMADYHTITYLLPEMAKLYFTNRMKLKLDRLQMAILLGMGLQHKEIDLLHKELEKPVSQLLGHFNRIMRKFMQEFRNVETAEAEAIVEAEAPLKHMQPISLSLDKELSEGAEEVMAKHKREGAQLSQSESLSKYAVCGHGEDWTDVIGATDQSIVSIKRSDSKTSEGVSSVMKKGGGKRNGAKAKRKTSLETIFYKTKRPKK